MVHYIDAEMIISLGYRAIEGIPNFLQKSDAYEVRDKMKENNAYTSLIKFTLKDTFHILALNLF